MALIRGGTFRMGSDDDVLTTDHRPVHDVRVDTFCIDRTEVSVAEYQACVTAGACTEATTAEWSDISESDRRLYSRSCNAGDADRANHPANCLDWSQARAYCTWSGGPGGAGRLPREAEWEFAARGVANRKYPWGDAPEPDAARVNLCGDECVDYLRSIGQPGRAGIFGWRDDFGATAPVTAFEPGETPEHVRNLAGNVSEWVEDEYAGDAYARHTPDGRLPPRDASAASAGLRVLRGGCWINSFVVVARATDRVAEAPSIRTPYIGVRCAREAR